MFPEINPQNPLWRIVCPAFGKEIKRKMRETYDYTCFECGDKVRTVGVHHRMPVCRGGSDRIENAVLLCNGEHGKGQNTTDDHHEKYDRLAIDRNLFLHPDGRLVTRDEMPDECFKFEDHNRMPTRRCLHEHHKIPKQGRHHRR